jgi:predicted dienelactone hydrolase
VISLQLHLALVLTKLSHSPFGINWADELNDSQVIFTALGLGNKTFDKVSFSLAELSFAQ